MHVVIAALWALVLTTGVIGVRQALHRTTWATAALAVAAAALGLLLRVTPSAEFYGLEYEDAYVYAVASRGLSTRTLNAPSGIAVCAIGSVERCEESEHYPGHLIGFPVLLDVVQSQFGFHSSLPPLMGAVLSTFAVLVVWWAAWVIHGSYSSAIVAALLYAATPALALYGGSACSESASALSVSVAVGAAATGRRALGRFHWWRWSGLTLCAALLGAFIRRENAIWLVVLPICLAWAPTALLTKRERGMSLALWSVALALTSPSTWTSLVSEVGEYGGLSFSLWRLVETLPAVGLALISPQWFGLLAIVACIGTGLVFWQLRRPRGASSDAVLLVGMAVVSVVLIASYSAHVRSAYQLMGVYVEPFDFLRYLSNLGVPLCVIAATAVPALRGAQQRNVLIGIACAYVVTTAALSWHVRAELSAAEKEVRTAPAVAAIEAASQLQNRYAIVTLEPLVVQAYAPAHTKVINLPALTPRMVEELGGTLIYINQEHYQTDEDRERYADGLAALPARRSVLRTGSGWSIVLLAR